MILRMIIIVVRIIIFKADLISIQLLELLLSFLKVAIDFLQITDLIQLPLKLHAINVKIDIDIE